MQQNCDMEEQPEADRPIRLPPFEDRSRPDRYCDVVLTGGITSAIAYPPVIHGLGSAYRFHAVGGTSSGAGSAALAAAAEYRRRHGSSDGFRVLLERTAAVAEPRAGKTALAWLFQPMPRHRRLFDALVPVVANPARGWSKGLLSFMAAYLPWLVAGAVLGMSWVALQYGLFQVRPTLAYLFYGVLTALGSALLFAAAQIAYDLLELARTDYGLCDGLNAGQGAPADPQPLTPWLHALLQEIAGRPVDGPPLTFADLHGAPGSPRATLGDASESARRGIVLQVFTANVTHRRPYLLPQEPDEPTLYFREDEMARLFPAPVVRHLLAHAQPYRGPARLVDGTPADQAKPPLYSLPKAELPVIVAARMSVSFPVLFRCVPLWAVDDRPRLTDGCCPTDEPPTMRRCLFADGGVCANFPVQLFDAPVPGWPTFGVSLRDLDPDRLPARLRHMQPDRGLLTARQLSACVQLPEASLQRSPESEWGRFDDRGSALARLGGLVGALLETTKNWNDRALAQLPGVRERVVEVSLPAGVGGLNILMNHTQIHNLVLLGSEAVKRLVDRYAVASTGLSGYAEGWTRHRWVRWQMLRSALGDFLSGADWAACHAPYALPLPQQASTATASGRPADGEQASPGATALGAELAAALSALRQAELMLARPVAEPLQPGLRPWVRIRPPL